MASGLLVKTLAAESRAHFIYGYVGQTPRLHFETHSRRALERDSFTFAVGEKVRYNASGGRHRPLMSTAEKHPLLGDGSAIADAHPPVLVDRENEPYRWRCGNRAHTDWDRTNSHVWCRGCLRQHESGDDVDPEHYEIWDGRQKCFVPWSAVVTPDDLRHTSRSELVEAFGERDAETLLQQVKK